MISVTTTQPPRLLAVDTMRFLAIIAVIIIHTCPFRDLTLEHDARQYNLLGVFLNQLARFGVPFFFTISGYFWGLKVRGGTPVVSILAQTAKRLLLVLVAASVIYALPYNITAIFEYGALGPIKVWNWHLHDLASNPERILFEATNQHLWFLIALLWAVAIATVFVYFRRVRYLVAVAVILYVFGILALAYEKTPVGIAFPFYTLQGPFFSTLFFVTGYILSGYPPQAKWLRLGVVFTLAGFAIHFSEAFLLWKWWQIRPFHHYLFGTVLIGLGVSMITLSDPPALRIKVLAKAGRYTLGIYVIHYIFVDWLLPVNAVVTHPAWEIGRVFLILGLALVVAQWMSKYKVLRKLVT